MADINDSLIGVAIRKAYANKLGIAQRKKNKYLERLKEIIAEVRSFLKENPVILTALQVTGVITTLVVVYFMCSAYNTFANFRNDCFKYYAQLGVEVKRRENLIPNLVVLVNMYSSHEKGIMKHVADARQTIANSQDMGKRIQATKQMEGMLSQLLALVEQYPDLKATETTKYLVTELTTTENRIAEMKYKYNESAKNFNDLYYDIPTSWFAKLFFGYKKPIMYIATDEDLIKVPLVDFNEQQEKQPVKQ